MKKLTITCKGGFKIEHVMENNIDHIRVLKKHLGNDVKSAIFQQYPKKNNEAIDLMDYFEKDQFALQEKL
jgi:hypothetical protein